jgi:hypothetical protein
MAHENLKATIEAVRDSNPSRWRKTPYENKWDRWGWHFQFPYGDLWHFVSVHNCEALPNRESLAHAIEGIEDIPDGRFGGFENKRCSRRGYYATAWSPRVLDGRLDHWFMIGRSWKKKIESAETEIRSLLLQKSLRKPEEEYLLKYLSSKMGRV